MVFVCVCERETERQRDRETETERQRQRDRQTETERQRESHTQRGTESLLSVCLFPLEPEEGVGSPGARVIGSCEPLDVRTWNQTGVLRKSSKPSTTEPSLKPLSANLIWLSWASLTWEGWQYFKIYACTPNTHTHTHTHTHTPTHTHTHTHVQI